MLLSLEAGLPIEMRITFDKAGIIAMLNPVSTPAQAPILLIFLEYKGRIYGAKKEPEIIPHE